MAHDNVSTARQGRRRPRFGGLFAATVATMALAVGCGGDDNTTADEPVTVVGSLFDDAEGLRLCESVMESYPPQCGEPVHPIDPGTAELPSFTTEGDRSWSGTVTITGTVDPDGTLVATSIEPF